MEPSGSARRSAVRPITVVWNAHAGSSGEASRVREDLLRRPDVTLEEPRDKRATERLAREAVERGSRLVVAAGGDGTVHAVANGMLSAGRQATLAVIPLGTANDLAGALGLPEEPGAAVRLWDDGRLRPIDVLELTTPERRRYCLNLAAGGNTQKITASLDADLKRRWGPWAYLRRAVESLTDLTVYQAHLVLDDRAPLTFDDVLYVLVANGRTAGRFAVAPHADLHDGRLDVVLIRNGSPAERAALVAHLALDELLQSNLLVYEQARRAVLRCTPRTTFSADGEPIDGHPLTFTVVPRALQVVVGDDR